MYADARRTLEYVSSLRTPMSCASARTWRASAERMSACFGVGGGSGPLNAGPGIFTMKSQAARKSNGRILAIAMMRIRPQRIDTVSSLRYITVNEAYVFAPASPRSLGPRGIAGGV